MPSDNTVALIAARPAAARADPLQAIRALRELQADGAPVTFDGVARAARDLPLLAALYLPRSRTGTTCRPPARAA